MQQLRIYIGFANFGKVLFRGESECRKLKIVERHKILIYNKRYTFYDWGLILYEEWLLDHDIFDFNHFYIFYFNHF